MWLLFTDHVRHVFDQSHSLRRRSFIPCRLLPRPLCIHHRVRKPVSRPDTISFLHPVVQLFTVQMLNVEIKLKT